MADDVNKNPLPRVVKGTGFYTPMDIAPGESSVSTPPTSAPGTVGEMAGGLPTSMDIAPPPSASPSTSQPTPPSQSTGDGESN